MRSRLFLSGFVFIVIASIFQNAAAQATPSPAMSAAMDLVRAQQWPDAETALAAVVKAEPNNGRAWFNLGIARHSLEKWESAIEAFKKTVEISQNPSAMYNVAAGYARQRKADSAFEWLEKALTGGAAVGSNIAGDPDFALIKSDPRFGKMLEIADRQTNPCKYSAESRQFDFWIGDWDVLVAGKKVGENLVQLELNGCALVENWKNLTGGLGKSLNSYNSSTKKWKQFYIDSSGSVLEFEGGFSRGVMHLEGLTIGADGSKTLHILEFHDLPDKTVRQWWQQSNDGGMTWATVWDSIYVRKKQ